MDPTATVSQELPVPICRLPCPQPPTPPTPTSGCSQLQRLFLWGQVLQDPSLQDLFPQDPSLEDPLPWHPLLQDPPQRICSYRTHSHGICSCGFCSSKISRIHFAGSRMHFPGIHSHGISSYGISSQWIHFHSSCSGGIHSYGTRSCRICSSFPYLSFHSRPPKGGDSSWGPVWEPPRRGGRAGLPPSFPGRLPLPAPLVPEEHGRLLRESSARSPSGSRRGHRFRH